MAARRPFWKWHRWKSIGFCLWPPWTCIWNLKLKFQSKLDLCSGNHVVYRQTDRRTDGRTRWIQYTPPPTSLGGGIINMNIEMAWNSNLLNKKWDKSELPLLFSPNLYFCKVSRWSPHQENMDHHVWHVYIQISVEHKLIPLIDIWKNIEKHTAHTIVSWPNPKQWVIVHTSDLMMIIRLSIYIFSIITKGMGILKTHSPTYCIMDNRDNVLNLTRTLDKLYLTGIL